MSYNEEIRSFVKTIWMKERTKFKFIVNGNNNISNKYSQVTVIIYSDNRI